MRGRVVVPAWLVSAMLHGAGLLLAGWLTQAEPRGTAAEPSREVGIVLVHETAERREYFEPRVSDDGDASDSKPAAGSDETGSATAALPGVGEAPLDPATALPDAPGAIPGAITEGLVGNAGQATRGSGGNRTVGGGAKTQVFGIEGEGHKFVYVFDRSDSMTEPQGRPLATAKAELIASLRHLDRTHQFQIIFFNHAEPVVFSPTGARGRLVFGDEATIKLAERFVTGIPASGGTKPEDALVMAVKMRPDIVFFLTDGQALNLAAVDRVSRLNRETAYIHAIEFGAGPGRPNGMMAELARRNHGKATYVDTTALGR